MSLTDLASIGSFVSGIAVVVSLLYLALQVHQNTKHTRALIQQGRAAPVTQQQMTLATSDVAAAVVAATGREPTAENIRQEQFRAVVVSHLFGWEDGWSQYQSGLVEKDAYLRLRTVIGRMLSQPAYNAEWQSLRVPGSNFANFVDEILSKFPAATNQPSAPTSASS